MPSRRDSAHATAEALAAMMRGADPGAGPAPGPPAVSGGVQVAAAPSSEDPVVRLEKLARLHAAGIVTDAQFEQLRAQILAQAGLDGGTAAGGGAAPVDGG